MEQLQELQTQLGLMTWPLIICSALTVMIITERLFHVLISLGVGKRAIRQKLIGLDQRMETILRRLQKNCRISDRSFIVALPCCLPITLSQSL